MNPDAPSQSQNSHPSNQGVLDFYVLCAGQAQEQALQKLQTSISEVVKEASAQAQAQVLLSMRTAIENSRDALATNQQYLVDAYVLAETEKAKDRAHSKAITTISVWVLRLRAG